MARPTRQGIDYFPVDVNMFGDRKIKRLLRAAGGKGFTIYIYLLTNIYEDKGYYYEWDSHSAFDISDDLNFSENVVEETVQACCSIGLFYEELFSAESILTSESIQNRWQKIVKDANRSETRIEMHLKIEDGKLTYPIGKTRLNAEETPEKSSEIPQSKGKKSKEEDSIYPFDEFWDEYDHKKERKKCERKWKRFSETTKETIKEFVPIYIAHTPDKQYRKYPSTFLNNEIWNDDWDEYPPQTKGGKNGESKGDKRAKQLREIREEWPQ